MFRHPGLAATALAIALAATPFSARADAPTPHVRGVVTAVNGDSITLKTDEGARTVMLTASTHYVDVHKSSLSAIDKNSFIGTATKDVGEKLVALEVVVFPEAMRGAGEGHYDWDRLPDTTPGGSGTVASTMTNGTVASTMTNGTVASTMTNGTVASTMTNGNVATADAAGGGKQLTVTYKGGEQHILVPPNVPVVTIAPGSRDALKDGAAVVVGTAKDSDTALFVAVGVDGAKPPM